MKIAIVTPYFYPKLGGLENYAYKMCKVLQSKYKSEIVIITSNHEERKYKKENLKGIKIYRLPYLFKLSNTPVNPLWYFQIKKILKAEKPDIINAHTPVPVIADITALVCGKIPFLLTYHAFSLYKYDSKIFNFIIKAYKTAEKNLLKKSTKIIVVSEAISETIPSEFKDKIVVINNALPRKEIPALANKKFQKIIPNIVFIGSLDKSHEWKGLTEILIALKEYKDSTKGIIQLTVIGEGNNKDYYIELTKNYGLEKYVNFVGRKDGESKTNILNNASIGIIFPKSSNDAFPTVALEYWANTIAIIASDILPINKIIEHKKTGYLVEAQSTSKLSESIKKLLTNKLDLKKVTKNGYTELTQRYVLENEVKKFHDLAKSLII